MAMMTPFQYAQNYWVLPVPLVDDAGELKGWDFAKVSKYRLANPINAAGEPEKYDAMTTSSLHEFESKINLFAKPKEDEEIIIYTKDLNGNLKTTSFKRGEKNRLLRLSKRAIWGKGTPEECQITLQLLYRFGVATNIQQLRQYCNDGKIGLDCNGFVGTYMRDCLGKKVDENTTILDLWQNGIPVKSFDEIKNFNVYVLAMVGTNGTVIARIAEGKHGHIMITSPTNMDMIGVREGKVYQRLNVVESTGGKGLIESDYLLLEEEKAGGKNTGVFKVHRGSKNEIMRVRMSRVYT